MLSRGRRDFIKKSAALSVSSILPITFQPLFKRDRKFRICLNPRAIGVALSQQELLSKAIEYGFESIVPFPDQLAVMRDQQLEEFLSEMSSSNIEWGASGLPVQFRESELKFKEEFARLHESADALKLAGAKRMSTWIMPTHKTLTYTKNLNQHAIRLREIAKLLGDYEIQLGLEYVGPKTLMTRDKYAFVRTMEECQELIDMIGEPNVGFQLDAFHWYCAGESKDDLLKLSPNQIVTVDLNDAKAGRSADEQLDWERELPTRSGLVNIGDFLDALNEIGYDGPVRAEPFNNDLNQLEDDEALQETIKAMQKAISKMN